MAWARIGRRNRWREVGAYISRKNDCVHAYRQLLETGG